MRFYVHFNSISVISGRWKVVDNKKAVCNGTPFTVEKISPRAGIELGLLDQKASASPTELPGLLHKIEIEVVSRPLLVILYSTKVKNHDFLTF